MRKLQPKPKDRRKVAIPDELRESLLEVYELICEAKRDPDINLDFDDAIQVGAVCGGRYGTKPRPYVLTYYPDGDRERGRWELTLHRTEIEDIGDGRMTEITLFCCASADCRSKFREADESCFYCDYVDDPNYGTFQFPAAATKLTEHGITGLTENTTRDDVIAALGPPDDSGGDLEQPPLGYVWPWVMYLRPDCRLRFEFSRDRLRIKNVTFLEMDWESGA